MRIPSPRPLTVFALAAVLAVGACTDTTGTDDGGATPSPRQTSTGDAAGSGGEAGSQGPSFAEIPAIVADVQPSIVSINVIVERNGETGLGSGSGVIWSADGIVVTNAHVVAEAEEIEVVLANGDRFEGEMIAADARTDLAAVRIDASGLPAADFAERLPVVGELAVALGNPLGFQNSATAGIVSGLDRSVPGGGGGVSLVGLIQTDAPISSGNSGGALVGADRQVLGINVAALGSAGAQSQGRITAENVGFAIPSTTVISVIEQLLEDGEVSHPYLGIRGATLTPQIADRFGLDRDAGVVVVEVVPDGPAEEAGIARGDVIVGLGDEEVRNFGDLAGILRDHDAGDTLAVTVVAEGEERTIEVTLAELPDR
ncbi:MAG: trypsin-like peptidase domain-containing protein [Nitriliruptorales bacterium]|nr:trypsin-like peptidase domain-containing protein [Nitriliruptorales bacterium]